MAVDLSHEHDAHIGHYRWRFVLYAVEKGARRLEAVGRCYSRNGASLTHDRKLKAVDFAGMFLAFGGITIFILGMTWGGGEYAWNSAAVISTLVIGVSVSVCFVLWQWKGPRYPLVPRELRNLFLGATLALTFISSHLQVQDRQWGMPHNGHQWLELCDASLLCAVLLPACVRLLGHQGWRHAITHHAAPDRQ